MRFLKTQILKIAYEEHGEASQPPVFLLHGWPDAPSGWRDVSALLTVQGYRTIIPYLRGSHPTEFLSDTTPRFAGAVALAQDVIDLADGLGIDRFFVVGHDWGARAAHTLAALFPERVHAIAALALAYQPRGIFQLGSFEQSRHFWYQFFMCTDPGAEAVRKDPIGFARIQWDTWSPAGWFTEDAFREASQTFNTPDWIAITLNGYRSRYRTDEVVDHSHDALAERLKNTLNVDVPALMIQGGSDYCDLPSSSEGREQYFPKGYRRVVLDGVGHFPQRENPKEVSDEVLRFFKNCTSGRNI